MIHCRTPLSVFRTHNEKRISAEDLCQIPTENDLLKEKHKQTAEDAGQPTRAFETYLYNSFELSLHFDLPLSVVHHGVFLACVLHLLELLFQV